MNTKLDQSGDALSASQHESPRDNAVATAAVVIVYFAFMLLVGFTPKVLEKPLAPGSPISVGILFGIFVTLFMVVAAKIYTSRRNRLTPDTTPSSSGNTQ